MVTFSTYYQTLIQLMLDVNGWKVVKRMTKQYYTFVKSLGLKYFPCQKNFHYYKIQHGGKN